MTEDEAADELFGLLDDAAARGKRHRQDGNYYFRIAGFTLVLAPDGRTDISYGTLHAERTPSEVRDGVKSRFKGRNNRRKDLTTAELAVLNAKLDAAVADVPAERWVLTTQVPEHFDPERSRITGGVIAHGRADRPPEFSVIRGYLRRAANSGQWTPGDHGRHILEHDGRRWLISAHGWGVLSCDPPWPFSAREEHELTQRGPFG